MGLGPSVGQQTDGHSQPLAPRMRSATDLVQRDEMHLVPNYRRAWLGWRRNFDRRCAPNQLTSVRGARVANRAFHLSKVALPNKSLGSPRVAQEYAFLEWLLRWV